MWKSESGSFTVGPLNTQFLQRGPGDQGTYRSDLIVTHFSTLSLLLECGLKLIKQTKKMADMFSDISVSADTTCNSEISVSRPREV